MNHSIDSEGLLLNLSLLSVNLNHEFRTISLILKFKSIINEKVKASGKLPFLVGGTGMYLSAILQNYKLRKADLSQNRIEELENYSEEKLRKLLLSEKPKQHNVTAFTS